MVYLLIYRATAIPDDAPDNPTTHSATATCASVPATPDEHPTATASPAATSPRPSRRSASPPPSVSRACGTTSLSSRVNSWSAFFSALFRFAPIWSNGTLSSFFAMSATCTCSSSSEFGIVGSSSGSLVTSTVAGGAFGKISSATYNWLVIRLPVRNWPRRPCLTSCCSRFDPRGCPVSARFRGSACRGGPGTGSSSPAS